MNQYKSIYLENLLSNKSSFNFKKSTSSVNSSHKTLKVECLDRLELRYNVECLNIIIRIRIHC